MTDADLDHLLTRLADPEAAPHDVPEHRLGDLCARATAHRVEAVVLRKLRDHAAHPEVRALSEGVMQVTALTMMLETRLRPIDAAIRAQGLPACIVKGGLFASRLFPHPTDRPWTDIDILADPAARDDIAEMLRDLGYRYSGAEGEANRNREEKWGDPEQPNLLIELHGDLVHYPMLRRGVRFGWAELLAAGEGDPRAPLALFATAVVHASLGHKFHELRLLVDVLQAFRALGPEDRAALPDRMSTLSLRLETALTLHLVAELFDQPDAHEMATALGLPVQSRLATLLVRPRDVLGADGRRLGASHLRRHAFRWLQQAHLSRAVRA
jgi:hypothetical protein